MFDLTTSEDTTSVISSPESAFGRTPFGSPDGLMTDLFGLVPVRANLSARQAKDLGLMMSGTFGPLGPGSSASAALQSSLESRLQARTSNLGSTLFKLTWKRWVTPSGVSRSRLRASALRTSATARTSWPTPRSADGEKNVRTLEGSMREIARKGSPQDLSMAACLCGWPTPTVGNSKGSQSFEGLSVTGRTPDGRKVAVSLNHVASFASWPSPTSGDSKGRDYQRSKASRAINFCLPGAAKLAAPSQGSTAESELGIPPTFDSLAAMNQPARLTASGEMLTGCSAGTKSGGQLNPAMSRWLMGLPPAWDECAPLTLKKSRRK